VEMLSAMARGDRHVFDGYAVNSPTSPFQVGAQAYSVIQLDFSEAVDASAPYDAQTIRSDLIDYVVKSAFKQHCLSLPPKAREDMGAALSAWVDALRAKEGNRPIVMLIDEYDAPVIAHLAVSERAEQVALILSRFYSMTKSLDKHFHKVFVTGTCLRACLTSAPVSRVCTFFSLGGSAL